MHQIKNISYNNQAIAVKSDISAKTMDRRDAYQTIVENPEALGYDSIDGHLDEIVIDIKEDLDNIFDSDIDITSIIKIIQNGKKKHF